MFDEIAEAMGVPQNGGDIVIENTESDNDGTGVFDEKLEALGAQYEQLKAASQGAPAAAPPPAGPVPPPVPQAPPAPVPGQPAPSAPPPMPTQQPAPTDPAVLAMLQKQNEVMERFAKNQEASMQHFSAKNEEQQQQDEMARMGMDPSSNSDIQRYMLYKHQQELDAQVSELRAFRNQFAQAQSQMATQSEASAAIASAAPHLNEQQRAFYTQRVAEASLQQGRPVADIAREWAPYFPAMTQVAPQAQPAGSPAQLSPQDMAAFRQLVAQQAGVPSAAQPQNDNNRFMRDAERALFGS